METSLLAEPAAAASVSAASAATAGGGEEQKEGVPQLVVVYEQAPSGNEDGEGGVVSPLQQQRDSFSSSLPPPQPLTLANMPQSAAASERRDSIPSMRLTAAQLDGYRKAGSALWNRKTVAAALLFVFLLIVVVSAATIGPKVLASSSTSTSGGGSPVVLIVSPYGDDEGGDGSSQRPFATITRAALGADGATPLPPGSSVLVGAGQYTLTAGIVTAVNGTASQRISFASIEPWGATLTWAPPLGARLSAGMWLNSGSFVDISGFQLQLGGSGAGSSGGGGPALVSGIVNSGRQVRVVGNYLHSAGTGTGTGGGTGGGGGAAISSLYPGATAGSGNIVSQNLVAFATSPSPSPLTAPAAAPAPAPTPATTPGQGAGPELHGILVAGGSDVVANNIVLGAPGDGVRLDCTAAAAAATAAPSSVAPCVASVGYNLVANCSGNGVSVLGLAGGTSAVSANALVFNAGSALATDTAAARFVARFNLVFRNGAGVCAAILQQQQAALCSSQTVADPGFAVPLSAAPAHYFGTAALAADVLRDFTPRCHGPKSPLVNGAEALPAVSLVDFLGQPRPRFGPVDAGPIQAHCRSSPRREAE